jgi:hypothetical protein
MLGVMYSEKDLLAAPKTESTEDLMHSAAAMDLAAQRQEEQEQRAVAATRVQAVARGKSTRAILLHSGSSFMSDIDGSNMDMDINDCWDAARAYDVEALRGARAAGIDLSKLAGLHSATMLHGAASAGAEASISYLVGDGIMAVDAIDQLAGNAADVGGRVAPGVGGLAAARPVCQPRRDRSAERHGPAQSSEGWSRAGVVVVLLTRGADITAVNEEGMTAQQCAEALLQEDEELGRPVAEAFSANAVNPWRGARVGAARGGASGLRCVKICGSRERLV